MDMILMNSIFGKQAAYGCTDLTTLAAAASSGGDSKFWRWQQALEEVASFVSSKICGKQSLASGDVDVVVGVARGKDCVRSTPA